MANKHARWAQRPNLLAMAAALLCTVTGQVSAIELDTGNPDLQVTLGNSVRYNLGMRAERRDPAIANTANNDEGTYSFNRGDVVTNRIDLLSELDVNYAKRFGLRLSGAAWNDWAFNDSVRTNPAFADRGSYTNNRYSAYTRRFNKTGAEFLDAYVFGNFDLGNMPANITVGRNVVLWGEAIALSAHSVSYAQAPSDGLKALATPGVDAKETALPVGQVTAKLQVLPELTLAAQTFYEWRPTRVAEGGTYLAGTDFILNGPDRFSMAPGMVLINQKVRKASDNGEWGVAARWSPDWLGGTLGLYHRRFHERSPSISMNLAAGTYGAVYPEGAKLTGISLSKDLAGISAGAELVLRQNTALNSSITDGAAQGARGNTIHVLLNGVKQWGPTALWSQATLTAEFAYSKLRKITSGETYFNGCYKRPAGDRGVETGCSTNSNTQLFLRFSPSWVAVAPGWDLTGTVSLSVGTSGNSAVLGGGNYKVGSYGIGLTATYNNLHDFSINYNGYLATHKVNPATGAIRVSNGSQIQDRGWLVFTYKTSF